MCAWGGYVCNCLNVCVCGGDGYMDGCMHAYLCVCVCGRGVPA